MSSLARSKARSRAYACANEASPTMLIKLAMNGIVVEDAMCSGYRTIAVFNGWKLRCGVVEPEVATEGTEMLVQPCTVLAKQCNTFEGTNGHSSLNT